MKAKRRVDEPTPKIQLRIVELVGNGAHLMTAAGASGVDAATFRRWMSEGRRNPSLALRVGITASAARLTLQAPTRSKKGRIE